MEDDSLPLEPAKDEGKRKLTNAELQAAVAEAAARSEKTEKAVESLSSKLGTILTALEGMTARSRGATTTPRVEVGAFEEATHGTAMFVEHKTEGVQLIKPINEDLATVSMQVKLEAEQFNSELLLIEILNDNNLEADTCFDISVNGRSYLFYRNREYTVPRYVVEGLIRARPIAYRNEEYVDKATGSVTYRYPANRGLRYPFNIKHDPSGTRAGTKGGDWYVRIMRQP